MTVVFFFRLVSTKLPVKEKFVVTKLIEKSKESTKIVYILIMAVFQ